MVFAFAREMEGYVMKMRTFALLGAGAALMLPAFVSAQGLSFFDNQASFRSSATAAGKFLKGVEDFEEALINPGQIVAMDDPLNAATNNQYFQPGFIEDN